MIKTFADRATRDLWLSGARGPLPPDIVRRAVRKLDQLDAALRLDDLKMPPGNRLHALVGDRTGQHAIAINRQWRICFRFDRGDAFDVQVCDYHK